MGREVGGDGRGKKEERERRRDPLKVVGRQIESVLIE